MSITSFGKVSCLASLVGAGWLGGLGIGMPEARAEIQWGLTVTNINNPISPIVETNLDGSLKITAGGGDTYDNPDSFTYAYQRVAGDFDIRVRVLNVEAVNLDTQDSAKGALMVRANLTPGSPNIQINAMPLAPFGRDGQLESIGRFDQGGGTLDLPGTGPLYTGDTLDKGACTYPDVWLRIRRQGDRFLTYYSNTNTVTGTNGWNILCSTPAGANFPDTLYVGLSTVAHNNDTNSADRVTATYANYGNTPTPASIPTYQGVAVPATNAPGALPQTVVGVNWNIGLPEDGMGYLPDILQSAQGAPSPIIWNSGGFGAVARDVLVAIDSQSPSGFSVARYQAGGLDFLISPRDPALAQENLGTYTNLTRERFSTGSITTPASQGYYPTPEEGFIFTTVRKNGQVWADGSPYFNAATYIQLDAGSTGMGYSPVNGAFQGVHFYTRTTKLVTGTPADATSSLTSLQRCAVPLSIAYFPYDQGWKAGYFNGASDAPGATAPGVASFKVTVNDATLSGDGYGTYSGAAVSGVTNVSQPAANLLTWVDTGSGDFSGLALLTLPGVDAQTNGMLFTVANDEGDTLRGPYANNAPLADGSGWRVAIRGIEESKSDPTLYANSHSAFSFLYVPFTADKLIGARIHGADASTIRGAGAFTLSRLEAGRYALKIPGKTGTNGMLLLINSGLLAQPPAGLTDVVDTCFLSYEYGGTNSPSDAFIIESRYLEPAGGADNLGQALPRDCDFNFVWVDFADSLTPAASVAQPKLAITRNGDQVVLSWEAGTGYTLQTTAALSTSPTWVEVGAQNPATIALAATNQYFRLIRK